MPDDKHERHRIIAAANFTASSVTREPVRRLGLLALAAAVAAAFHVGGAAAFPRCAAGAKFTYVQKHVLSKTVAKLMPDAGALGFARSIDHGPQIRRRPYWPGWCGSWWVEYVDWRGGNGYVDVSFTVYRTHAQALSSLHEDPYLLPARKLPNGAEIWVDIYGGSILSVVENVIVSSISSYSLGVGNVPDHSRPPDVGVSVQMKIHRAIQAGVLQS